MQLQARQNSRIPYLARLALSDGKPLNAEQKRKLARINAQLGLASRKENPLASIGTKPPAAVVTLSAPRDIWITGEDANLELCLQLGFRIEFNEQVQVFGKVEIRRGSINLLGQRFDLKEA